MRIDSLEALTSGAAKLWMILTGINDYEDSHFFPLRYAMADCMKFAAALEAATESFPNKETIVHCQTEHSLTLEALRANLSRVATQAGVNDIILFYWAGHGLVETVGQPLYLCLPETHLDRLAETGLSLLEVLQTLKQCQATKQLMMIDTCHSGSLSLDRRGGGLRPRDSLQDFNSEQQARSTSELKQALEQYAGSQQDFYALLSCDRDQQSWESAQLQHGVFTYFLIEGIKGKASDSRGIINVLDLFRYVYNETRWYVGSANQEQTPCQIIRSASGELVIGLAERSKDFQELYADHLNDYEQSFIRALCKQYPLQEEDRKALRRLQLNWRLTPNDVYGREERIIHACEACKQDIQAIMGSQDLYSIEGEAFQVPQLHRTYGLKVGLIESILRTVAEAYERVRQQYETEAFVIIRQYHPHHGDLLQQVQQRLQLTPNNVASTTDRLVAEYEAIVAAYRQDITHEIAQYARVDDYPLKDFLTTGHSSNAARPQSLPMSPQDAALPKSVIYQRLQQMGRQLGLRDEVTTPIIQAAMATYRSKLDYYRQQAAHIIDHHHPDHSAVDQLLQGIQGDLTDPVAAVINQRLRIEHQQRVDRYKQRINALISQQYPLEQGPLMESFRQIAQEEDVTDSVARELNDRAINSYLDLVNQYRADVSTAVHTEFPLNDVTYRYLRRQRDNLGLVQEVAAAIEDEVFGIYEQKEARYQAAIANYLQQQAPLSVEAEAQLQQLQQELGLRDTAAKRLQQLTNHDYQQTLDQYQAAFTEVISHRYPISYTDRRQLQTLQQQLSLRDSSVMAIEHLVLQSYEPKLQQYQQVMSELVHQYYPLEVTDNEPLKELQVRLQLSDEISAFLRSQVIHAYEQNLQDYEQLATRLVQQTYPLSELSLQQLQAKQVALKLNSDIARLIRDRVITTYQNRLKAYEQQLKNFLNP